MSDDQIEMNHWFNEFSDHSIFLSSEALDRATEISQRSRHREKRWQIYLSALALVGFEQWLRQSIHSAKINFNRCTILEPPSISSSTAVCNLEINGFRVCLVEIGAFITEMVFFPKAVIDSIDVSAHFYVPVSVDEESNAIAIHGFLRRDLIKPNMLSGEAPGFYAVSIDYFEANLDRFLLFLECLEPQAIQIPVKPSPLELDQLLVKPAIQLKHWIQQQWNELIDIDWKLVASESVIGGMRSTKSQIVPASDVAAILKSLQQNGTRLIHAYQGICKDFEYAEIPLRLYVIPAASTSPDEDSMMLILKQQNGQNLPSGLRFQINDAENMIGEHTIQPDEDSDFSYCQVFGTSGEQFYITLQLFQMAALTLEPIEL